MKSLYPIKSVGDVLKLEYGKPLPEADRASDGSVPAYGANGVLCWSRKAYRTKPSIIVGRKGSAGEINLTEGPFWPTDVTYFVEHDERASDLQYLFYALRLLSLQKLAKGVKPGINRNDIYALKVPLPSLPEQKRIAAILDEAFEGIDKAIANAEQNLANARELFDSYLTAILKKDFDQWNEKSLGSVCNLFQGLAINKGTKHLLVSYSRLPLLRIKDLRDGTAEQYVAETGFPKNSEIFPHDIIYTRTGQIGLVFRGRQGVLHNNSFKVVPRSELDRNYLFWWLQEPLFRRRIVALASRAAQPDITHKLFQSERISIPPMNYQREAVDKIEKLYADTQNLSARYQQKICGLVTLKESVLGKAFSGELTARLESARQEAAE